MATAKGVIETATGDLLRAGMGVDFENDGTFDASTESFRTDVPVPFKVRSGLVFLTFDRWTGTEWIEVSNTPFPKVPFAQLSDSTTQTPPDTNPVVITYDTQDAIDGITHSTTVDSGVLTVQRTGAYYVMAQPQVGKFSGGTKVEFDMFLQVDRGSGFADEPNTNIKLVAKDADVTDVIVSGFLIVLNRGDKIRMMQRISSTTGGLGLMNTDPVVGPPSIPRTPSIIFMMYGIGGF